MIFRQVQQVLSPTASPARALVEKQSSAEAVTTPCPEPAEAAPAQSLLVASGMSQESSRKRRLKPSADGAGLWTVSAEVFQVSLNKAHTLE